MTIKQIIESTIQRGGYDLATILERIDSYHIEGKLTNEERESMYTLARQHAKVDMNAGDEIQAIWAAIHDIRSMVEEIEQGLDNIVENVMPYLGVKDDEDADDEETDEDPEQQKEPQEKKPDAWHAPTGAHDAYYNGMEMLYTDGKAYRCIAPSGFACVWPPEVMPSYWEVISE